MKEYLHISRGIVDETLHTAATQGIRHLEPFKTIAKTVHAPISILEEVDAKGSAEVHEREADLWLCLEGESIFTIGGNLINAHESSSNEITGESIEGGKEIIFKEGDWLWIPVGIPHRHRSSGKTRMVIIKVQDIDNE